ncbi:MAG: efflux RND transporter periplasmic adaptor subunit [Deltaproteobacteria bacterium]|nr:MAG: efflux RND transporter periplasmic adaptor subunit [Deltaproteobacteria bacterium]
MSMLRSRSSHRSASMRKFLPATILMCLLVACGPPPEGPAGAEEQAEEPDRRVLVEAAPVQRGDVADYLVTTGTLESEAQADIIPEATGVVTRILVEEGDTVRRGQLLAELSNPSLEAAAERARVELARARREAESARALHARGAISDAELRAAEDALTTAEASFSEAAATSDFTRIESPIDGTVAVRDLRVGELAGQGRAFQIVDLDHLRVIVRLPEKDLDRVRVGQPVVLQGAYDDQPRGQGRVARISPVVDPQTGTVRVTIEVDADTTDLRPGQFVKVRIEVARHEDVLTIPRRALTWIDGEPVAWKVVDATPDEAEDSSDEGAAEEAAGSDDGPGFLAKLLGRTGNEDEADGTDEEPAPPPWPLREAERADLEIGFVDTTSVEVLSGLAEGDLVVTVGNDNLRSGTPLRLPDDPGPEAADAAEGDDGAVTPDDQGAAG